MRRKRGFVQLAILHLLEQESMHGYQIMKELEDRSNGAYSASAGTVYPALQELEDQDLIRQDVHGNKKIYSINTSGLNRLEEIKHDGDFWEEWKERMTWRNSKEFVKLKSAMERWEKEVRNVVKKTHGNPEEVTELITFIDGVTEQLKKKSKK